MSVFSADKPGQTRRTHIIIIIIMNRAQHRGVDVCALVGGASTPSSATIIGVGMIYKLRMQDPPLLSPPSRT